jgi:succinyl-CoA synthetase beta subunit
VKAQIHAGGRGKGGGVKVVKGAERVAPAAPEMLGMMLVTPQTGPEGKKVRSALRRAGPRRSPGALPRRSCSIATRSASW